MILVSVGLCLQFEAIYSDYIFNKRSIENPGLFICFFSPYQDRWLVQLFGFIGIGISILILFKLEWIFPNSLYKKLILFSPIFIFILDEFMVRIIL